MIWPLRILGVGSVVVGLVGVSKVMTFGVDLNWFEHFLHAVAPGVEVHHHPSMAVEWALIVLSVAVAGAGIALARSFYFGPRAFEKPRQLAERLPALYRAVANKYYVDELYDLIIVRPLEALARFTWKGIDTVAIDGTLNASAFFTEISGDVLRFVQTGNVRNYALMVLLGAVAAAVWLLV